MIEERQLLKATIAGDTAAFEVLVRKYQNLVCAITFSGTGRIEASEELAQETFFSAWRNLRKLKDLELFRPWLCSIARNLVRNYHRNRKTEVSLPENHVDIVDPDNNPSQNAVTREETMILEQALNRIPIEYREPLVLFYREGQSIQQVAGWLGLNEGTVKTRLHRGRQMLKEQTTAIVERTLEKTVPDAQFTKTVMIGIVAGTANAAAATIGTTGTAATSGGSVLSVAGSLFGTLTGKIVVTVTAVAITAGVAVYTYHNGQESDLSQAIAAEGIVGLNTQPQTKASAILIQEPQHVEADNQEHNTETDLQAVPQETKTANKVETIQDLPPARHPDWPGLDEPVEYIYTKLLSGQEMWVHLPRRFREENAHKILIDNGQDRIEVSKTDMTVQYSDTLTAGEIPFYNFEKPLIHNDLIIFANLFRNSLLAPAVKQAYTIEKIEQKEYASMLVYEIYDDHIDSSKYNVKAFVGAATLLPQKIIATNNDPNASEHGQVVEEVVFDFAPIPDSIFEYTAKTDETLLARKEAPCFRGTVVDTLNNPVADANVFVHYFPLWDKDYLTGKTDAEGKFDIKIPPKPHEISINLPVFYWAVYPNEPDKVGWTVLQKQSDPSFEEMKDVTNGDGGTVTQNGEPIETVEIIKSGVTEYRQALGPFLRDPVIEDIQLVMEPAATITGVVTDKEGSAIPVAQLSMDFQMSHGNYYSPNLNWKFTAVSDVDGHYEFHGLPALWEDCAYFVTCSADGYVTEREYIRLQETLDILEFDILLERKLVTIHGFLADNYGTALANRQISVSAPNMSIRDCSTRTDPNGCFILDGCPDVAGLVVNADLSESHPPYDRIKQSTLYNSYVFYPDVEKTISYVAGQREYFIELTAIQPETTVEVTVTDTDNRPLSDFKVKIDGKVRDKISRYGDRIPYVWQQVELEKRTDPQGTVIFDNVPDLSEMRLIVSSKEYFTEEMHNLVNNYKEQQRLQKIDEKYNELYEPMQIPIELVEGQTDYFVEVVVLTKEEAQSLPEITP